MWPGAHMVPDHSLSYIFFVINWRQMQSDPTTTSITSLRFDKEIEIILKFYQKYSFR